MKLISFLSAIGLGLLAVAPPINYNIPLIVNSFNWCYLVIAAGLFGMFLLFCDIHWLIKGVIIYLFINCFLSQVPYLSFNAYILCVFSVYCFMLFRVIDKAILLNMLAAVFWLQFILVFFQMIGMDKLLNFGAVMVLSPEGQAIGTELSEVQKPVFLGTVMQYMRLASLIAILSPFLLIKSKWYIIPITLMVLVSKSSGLALSVIAGVFTYVSLLFRKDFLRIAIVCFVLAVLYLFYDLGSFMGAVNPAHGGRLSSWYAIFITWFIDTSKSTIAPFLYGPFNLKWFLFGHGMDTFLPLFPVYKHDINPFPQAHNCWLQFLWEIGAVGTSFIAFYVGSLAKRLYKRKEYLMLSGMACLGTNMFFAFPTRMTQTKLLLICYLAFCEKQLSKRRLK